MMRQSLKFLVILWLATGFLCVYSARAVKLPGCQVQAPGQTTLENVQTVHIAVPAPPFGVVYALRGNVAFVSLNDTLGILNTTTFWPSLLHQVQLPRSYFISSGGEGALGLSLTHKGRYVLVALGTAAIIVDAAKAIAGSADAVVGALNGTAGATATEVTTTLDDEYAFVSQEYGRNATNGIGNIEVFRLLKPDSEEHISDAYIGSLSLGEAVVGIVLSPDGSTLYATSEIVRGQSDRSEGSLSVLDVETLKKDPRNARISVVRAGCGTVRAAVPSDGKTVWVTARESNHVLAFDAAKLISNKTEALLASIQVGTSPVGLIFAKNDTRILTADSNRFGYPNTTSGISIVDVAAALQGKSAVLGRVPTGVFPREFALSRDDSTVLVTNFGTPMDTLTRIQAIDVATVP